jgi:hypothetical protein
MSLSIELEYGKEKHDRILTRIRELIAYSDERLATFRAACNAGEEHFQAYIEPPKDENSNAKDDLKRPAYKTLKIPYSYAVAMTMHTYLTSVFLARSPIFQVEGRHGEGKEKELSIESYLDYQIVAGESRAMLYNWLMDPLRYGVGIIGCYWDKQTFHTSKIVEVENLMTEMFPKMFPKKRMTIEEEHVSFEGNKLYNVRPIDFGWDPRYSLGCFQQGEFCFEKTTLPTTALTKSNGYIEKNMEIVHKLTQKLLLRETGFEGVVPDPDNNSLLRNIRTNEKVSKHFSINACDFYWNLIPAEWGLGSSQNRQKWHFCVAEDEIITSARPCTNLHNSFPYSILLNDVDLYKLYSRSVVQIVEPMETVIDWLVNQHFYNVRKHLNNHAIIDPSMIYMKDLYTAAAQGYIRKRPEAYGQDPQFAYWQLPKSDITRANLSDVRMIEEFAQRLNGVNDNVMGLVNPGGRKTAAEVRTSSSYATNRLKTLAEWFSATGFSALSKKMIINSQQYMDIPLKLKIAGDMYKPDATTDVNRDSIAGFYDFSMVDGTMPIDRMAAAQIMQQIFASIAQNPQIASNYNLLDMFEYIATISGARNIKRFRMPAAPVQTQIIPDGQVPANSIPLREVSNGY